MAHILHIYSLILCFFHRHGRHGFSLANGDLSLEDALPENVVLGTNKSQ